MKIFTKRRILLGALILSGLVVYTIFPALEPMPDATPLRANLPNFPDGAGTLRLLEHVKEMKHLSGSSISPEEAAVIAHIKQQLETGVYKNSPELHNMYKTYGDDLLVEDFTHLVLSRIIPFDLPTVQKILNLPENRELMSIFDEETDFRENPARVQKNFPEDSTIHKYIEFVKLCRLKIRVDLAYGNIVSARKRFAKAYSILRFNECEANSSFSGFLLSMLQDSFPDFFLGKNPPDAKTIDFLKHIISDTENNLPDFHVTLRREFNYLLAFFDRMTKTDSTIGNSYFNGICSKAREHFRLLGLKKTFLKEVLLFLPDIEAQTPLESIVQKCETRKRNTYRNFRETLNIYGAFDSLYDKYGEIYGTIKKTHLLSRHYRNRISAGKIMLACYCYRQKHGTFPPSLDALVPEYLKSVPEHLPCGNAPKEPAPYALDPKTLVVFPKNSEFGGKLREEYGYSMSDCAFRLSE